MVFYIVTTKNKHRYSVVDNLTNQNVKLAMAIPALIGDVFHLKKGKSRICQDSSWI